MREEAGGEIDVLEIGSWEGLSALWFAQNLRARFAPAPPTQRARAFFCICFREASSDGET